MSTSRLTRQSTTLHSDSQFGKYLAALLALEFMIPSSYFPSMQYCPSPRPMGGKDYTCWAIHFTEQTTLHYWRIGIYTDKVNADYLAFK